MLDTIIIGGGLRNSRVGVEFESLKGLMQLQLCCEIVLASGIDVAI